jgi:hypothetical protein
MAVRPSIANVIDTSHEVGDENLMETSADRKRGAAAVGASRPVQTVASTAAAMRSDVRFARMNLCAGNAGWSDGIGALRPYTPSFFLISSSLPIAWLACSANVPIHSIWAAVGAPL